MLEEAQSALLLHCCPWLSRQMTMRCGDVIDDLQLVAVIPWGRCSVAFTLPPSFLASQTQWLPLIAFDMPCPAWYLGQYSIGREAVFLAAYLHVTQPVLAFDPP